MANDTFNSTLIVDTFSLVVGSCYLIVGLLFIILQTLCAYLIGTNKEMQNPTYRMMVNLAIIDSIELIAIGPYAGITLLIGYQDPIVGRLMSFVCLTAWYSNCVLLVLIAWTRWVAITKSHMVNHTFSKRMMFCLHLASFIPTSVICFFSVVVYKINIFPFFPEAYSWSFDLSTNVGEIWHWFDCAFNLSAAAAEIGLSIMAWVYVHKKRKEIQSFTATEMRRKETKLLLQCFIIGCVFIAAALMFAVVNFCGWSSIVACICTQSIWIFNHCVNPIVYLSVNKALRRKLVRFLTCWKNETAVTTICPERLTDMNGAQRKQGSFAG